MQQIPLFLFHLIDTDLFAFSSEMSGANLPLINDERPWTFLEELKSIQVEGVRRPSGIPSGALSRHD
jgi:hypothetical protein